MVIFSGETALYLHGLIDREYSEICAIPLEDDVTFCITSVSDIMTDFEYPGVRMMFEAVLE